METSGLWSNSFYFSFLFKFPFYVVVPPPSTYCFFDKNNKIIIIIIIIYKKYYYNIIYISLLCIIGYYMMNEECVWYWLKLCVWPSRHFVVDSLSWYCIDYNSTYLQLWIYKYQLYRFYICCWIYHLIFIVNIYFSIFNLIFPYWLCYAIKLVFL